PLAGTVCILSFFSLSAPLPPGPTLFPYTTLFRSDAGEHLDSEPVEQGGEFISHGTDVAGPEAAGPLSFGECGLDGARPPFVAAGIVGQGGVLQCQPGPGLQPDGPLAAFGPPQRGLQVEQTFEPEGGIVDIGQPGDLPVEGEFDRMVEGGFEEFGLVREVIVDARRRDSGGGGDVGDAHGIEAVPAEQRPSGLNDVALR